MKRQRTEEINTPSEEDQTEIDDDYYDRENKCLGKLSSCIKFPKNSLPIEEKIEKEYNEKPKRNNTLFNRHYSTHVEITSSKFIKLPNNSTSDRFLLISFIVDKEGQTFGVAVFDLWRREFIRESEFIIQNVEEQIDLILIENSSYFLCFTEKLTQLMKLNEDGRISFVKDLETIQSSKLKEGDILKVHSSVFNLKLTSEGLETRESFSCFTAQPESTKEMNSNIEPSANACHLFNYNSEEGSGSVVSYGGASYRSYSSSTIIRFDFNDGIETTKSFQYIHDAESTKNATAMVAGRYLMSFCGKYKDRLVTSTRIGIFDCFYNCRIGHLAWGLSEEDPEIGRVNSQAHYLARENKILLFGGRKNFLFYKQREDVRFTDLSFIEMKLPTFVLPSLRFSLLSKRAYFDIIFE